MNEFYNFFRQYSGIGLANGIGDPLFQDMVPGSPFLATNPDADLQRISESAFNFNQFLGGSIADMQPTAPTQAELEALADEANGSVWSLENIATNQQAGQIAANSAVNKRLEEYNEQVENYDSDLSAARKYSGVTGALAGLQELSSMEAEAQQRVQEDKFRDIDQYRVEPTNGMGNFGFEQGGDPHKPTRMEIPKDFKMPRLNLTNTNIGSISSLSHYEYGGVVEKKTPVGNYMSHLNVDNNRFEGTNRTPIQTESGGKGKEEMIALPTLDLVPVAAEKRHKQVDRDLVTDYVPEGSYIFSQFGDFKLSKEDAEELTTEVGIPPYNLFGKTALPTKKTLADVMDKNKMTPADVVRNIKKKFKTSDRIDDPFTEKTNTANRLASEPYIKAAILLSEIEKEKKGIVNELDQQQQESQDQTPPKDASLGGGGLVHANKPPKAAFPLAILPSLIGAGSTLIGGIMGDNANRRAQQEARRLREENLADISELSATQQRNNTVGAAASIGSQLLQDTTVDVPQLSIDAYLAQRDQISPTTIDNISNSNFRNINAGAIFSQAPNFANGVNAMSLPLSQAFQANNNLRYQNEAQGLANRNNRLGLIQNTINQQAGLNTQASNQQRGLNNQRLAGIGSTLQGALNTQNNILGNETNAKMAARGAAFSAISQLQNQRAQNFINTGAAFTQTSQGLFDYLGQQQQNNLAAQRAQAGQTPPQIRQIGIPEIPRYVQPPSLNLDPYQQTRNPFGGTGIYDFPTLGIPG